MLKHNPSLYFQSIRTNPQRCANAVPLSQLSADLAANTVPDFAWIGPNLCHSTHGCPLEEADRWLASVVSSILASPAWKDGGVLIITWDEGNTDAGCCAIAEGGRIPLVVVSSRGPFNYRSSTPYSHYSLLRSLEDNWGLRHLGHAADAGTRAMDDLLPPPGR